MTCIRQLAPEERKDYVSAAEVAAYGPPPAPVAEEEEDEADEEEEDLDMRGGSSTADDEKSPAADTPLKQGVQSVDDSASDADFENGDGVGSSNGEPDRKKRRMSAEAERLAQQVAAFRANTGKSAVRDFILKVCEEFCYRGNLKDNQRHSQNMWHYWILIRDFANLGPDETNLLVFHGLVQNLLDYMQLQQTKMRHMVDDPEPYTIANDILTRAAYKRKHANQPLWDNRVKLHSKQGQVLYSLLASLITNISSKTYFRAVRAYLQELIGNLKALEQIRTVLLFGYDYYNKGNAGYTSADQLNHFPDPETEPSTFPPEDLAADTFSVKCGGGDFKVTHKVY